jgi:hypothetical protein
MKGGYQGLTILHFALFPTNMTLSLLILKSEEYIDLVATDSFCKTPRPLHLQLTTFQNDQKNVLSSHAQLKPRYRTRVKVKQSESRHYQVE